MTTLAEPKTSVIIRDRKQITSKYTDGTEMIEEFDVITDELLLRKRRQKKDVGGYTNWIIEIGAETPSCNLEKELIVESSGSPVLVRQDTKDAHVFRIRNLPYPKDVYSITVERKSAEDVGEIVVRTSNKKYFKRIDIPDMTRMKLPLEESQISFEVQHNTLIIKYKKHLAVLAAENESKKERTSLPSKRIQNEKDQCPQQ